MICDLFWFNLIWLRLALATPVWCWRLVETDITVHHQSLVWIDYIGDIITLLK